MSVKPEKPLLWRGNGGEVYSDEFAPGTVAKMDGPMGPLAAAALWMMPMKSRWKWAYRPDTDPEEDGE